MLEQPSWLMVIANWNRKHGGLCGWGHTFKLVRSTGCPSTEMLVGSSMSCSSSGVATVPLSNRTCTRYAFSIRETPMASTVPCRHNHLTELSAIHSCSHHHSHAPVPTHSCFPAKENGSFGRAPKLRAAE